MNPREAALERAYPHTSWREPLPTYGSEDEPRLACRFCIAFFGLRAEGLPDQFADRPELLTHLTKLPKTQEEFDRHMREVHSQNEVAA